MESKVSWMLFSENTNTEATIISSISSKNGDCVIKFNESDDVNSIAKKMKRSLGYKAQSRPIFIPKMTIWFRSKEHFSQWFFNSTNCEIKKNGERFEALFTYEVKDWGIIVCRVSPKIRAEIIFHGNVMKIVSAFDIFWRSPAVIVLKDTSGKIVRIKSWRTSYTVRRQVMRQGVLPITMYGVMSAQSINVTCRDKLKGQGGVPVQCQRYDSHRRHR